MKIKVNESELREIAYEMIKKALNEIVLEGKTKKINSDNGYLKANRQANREIEKELKGDGFKSTDKVHKSPKDYSRKGRNKDSWKKEIEMPKDY